LIEVQQFVCNWRHSSHFGPKIHSSECLAKAVGRVFPVAPPTPPRTFPFSKPTPILISHRPLIPEPLPPLKRSKWPAGLQRIPISKGGLNMHSHFFMESVSFGIPCTPLSQSQWQSQVEVPVSFSARKFVVACCRPCHAPSFVEAPIMLQYLSTPLGCTGKK